MERFHLPHIDDQREFWESHWEHWRERKTINEWKDRRHEAVLAFLKSVSLDRAEILDLGCGPGYYTEKLSRFGEVTGLDLSDRAIALAKSKYPHIRFIAGNLYDSPLPFNAFDVVVSQEVFDHVEDQPAFLDRVAQLLRPRGYLILSCTNRFVMERVDAPSLGPAHITKCLTMKEFKGLLKRNFRVLRTRSLIPRGHRGILRLINSHKLNTAVARLITAQTLDAWKEWAGFGYQLLALAEKKS